MLPDCVKRLALAICLLVAAMVPGTDAAAAPKPAAGVGDQRLEVAPGAYLPIFLSRDWSKPLPDVDRVVIIQHGHGRDAPGYFQGGLTAQTLAGDAGKRAMIIAPDFVKQVDVDTFHLEDSVLRFPPAAFETGGAATGPQPIGSYAVYDALLARLADRRIFPNLKIVVVAGHSAGGQVVQRYAILGKGEAALTRSGIAVRYVVANPSSFAYFSADRPEPAIAATCPGYNDWKYGMTHLPAYAGGRVTAELEATYVARHVTYLLGTRDTNPNHPELDKSCMAEAEGRTRWARGHAFVAYMQARDHGAANHMLYEVQGVGHNGPKMFESACGLTALFDVAGCE